MCTSRCLCMYVCVCVCPCAAFITISSTKFAFCVFFFDNDNLFLFALILFCYFFYHFFQYNLFISFFFGLNLEKFHLVHYCLSFVVFCFLFRSKYIIITTTFTSLRLFFIFFFGSLSALHSVQ